MAGVVTAQLSAGGADRALFPLREELTLYAGPCTHGGVPRWTLHDPACNRFFRIGWPEFEILSRWRPGRSAESLAHEVTAETTLSIERDVVDALSKFLQANNLLQLRGTTAPKHLAAIKDRMRPSWAQRLLRNHLFIRLPLIRPDALLVPLQRLTGFAFTRGFLWLTVLAAVIGLYLAARQWDTYVATFLHFLDWSGMALFAITLVVIKMFHELGHALTARRFGCRVPTMGVAFLVFWPVLYTDTTDAWKLSSKRARLAISAAGLTVELMIAAYATLAWSFLPPGPLQSAAFLAATTTWVLSLVINLNPFMRFDGYFILTDLLNVHNLQERSFALAKWRLREALFGFGEAPPEPWSPAMRRGLLVYAYLTWAYRAALYIGIALVFYHFLFKMAGVVLLLLEISWLVAFPVAREVGEWVKRRDRLRLNRQLLTTVVVLGGIGLALAMPWTTRVTAPALLRTDSHAVIYAPAAARVDSIAVVRGGVVEVGDRLVTLASPDLDDHIDVMAAEVAVLEWQRAFEQFDAERRQQHLVVESKLNTAKAAMSALHAERDRLMVTAPISGEIVELADAMRADEWVSEGEVLLVIAGTTNALIEAFIPEREITRVSPGAAVVFIADNLDIPPIPGVVEAVDTTGLKALDNPYVASLYGGGVPVRETADGRLIPESAHYRVSIRVEDEHFRVTQMTRGEVVVEAERLSLLSRAWTTVLAVFIRESSF